MHKMEHSNRLMSDKGTLQKALELFHRGHLFSSLHQAPVTATLSRGAAPKAAPTEDALTLPDTHPYSRFPMYSGHAAKIKCRLTLHAGSAPHEQVTTVTV